MLKLKDYNAGIINYIEGGVPPLLDLPTDYALHSLRCRFSGRLKITAAEGGDDAGVPYVENPLSLIERIRIFGSKPGGAVEIINDDAASIFRLMHEMEEQEGSLVEIASGAAGSTDFVADLTIPLSVIGKKVKDRWRAMSLLPAWWFSELKMEVKFRQGTSVDPAVNGGMISGGTNTLALTSYGSDAGVPSINVVAIQATNINKPKHKPLLMKIYKTMEVTEAVESQHRVKLNRGNYYRAVMVKTFTDTDERPVSNTILKNIQVAVAGNAEKDWPFLQLQDDNKKSFGLSAIPEGYAIIDFCKEGNLKTMLDTRAMSANGTTLETILDVNGAAGNRTEVHSIEVLDSGSW